MSSDKSEKFFDAFLSHNSKDKPEVEKIAESLTDSMGFNVFLDRWNLVPGEPWQEALETALNESMTCVVFVGPHIISPWQNEEMRSALSMRVSKKMLRVIPVLLPGAVKEEKESELPLFLQGLTWVKFSNDLTEEDALWRLECGVRGIPPGRNRSSKPPPAIVCPFRGLEIFREQDEPFFFGRDAIIQQLKDHLDKYNFLAVIGPSGSGKSSIVQAGLIPQLRSSELAITIFSPRTQPLDELALALSQITGPDTSLEKLRNELRDSQDGDALYLHTSQLAKANKRVLLVIDQFEELFTQTDREAKEEDKIEKERQQFIALLLNVKKNKQASIILTMRSDFIGRCASYPDLNTFVNDHFIQVGPMSPEELRSAIAEPGRVAGLQFEAGLVDQILEDAKGASSELPLIEYALTELWQRRQGNLLTYKAYQAIGGVEGALVNRAEVEFKKLTDEQQAILARMFVLRLIQPGEGTEDTRRRATREELLATGGKSILSAALVDRWSSPEVRMLTSYQTPSRQEVYVDVAHEALIRRWARIKEWVNDNREATRLIGQLRQVSVDWENNGRDQSDLLQGRRLLQMEELLQTYADDLTELEAYFVQQSVQLQEDIKQKEIDRQNRELEDAQKLAEARKKQLEDSQKLAEAQQRELEAKARDEERQKEELKDEQERAKNLQILTQQAQKNEEKAIQNGQKATRRSRIALWLAILAFGTAGLAGYFWKSSNKAANEAKSLYWASESDKLLPTQAIRLLEKSAGYNLSANPIYERLVRRINESDSLLFNRLDLTHQDIVRSAMFSSDGSRILTASADKTAKLRFTPEGALKWLKNNKSVAPLSVENKRKYDVVE